MNLFDTNVAIDFLSGVQEAVQWFQGQRLSSLAIPGIVAMELIQGPETQSELRTVLSFIDRFQVVWPSEIDGARALKTFSKFRLSHKPDLPDVLIAQTVIGVGGILFTRDQKIGIIPGLKVKAPW